MSDSSGGTLEPRPFIPTRPTTYREHCARIAMMLAEGLHDGKRWKPEAHDRYAQLENGWDDLPDMCDSCKAGDHKLHGVIISRSGAQLQSCYVCNCDARGEVFEAVNTSGENKRTGPTTVSTSNAQQVALAHSSFITSQAQMSGGTLEERARKWREGLSIPLYGAACDKAVADFARQEAEPIAEAGKKLLEWMPTCSVGSSGYIRQENLRAAIRAYAAPNLVSPQ